MTIAAALTGKSIRALVLTVLPFAIQLHSADEPPVAVAVTAIRSASHDREIEMGRFHDLMDRELRIRGFAENTRKCYLEKMRCFVRHFMRPPDQLTAEEVMQYQLNGTTGSAWIVGGEVLRQRPPSSSLASHGFSRDQWRKALESWVVITCAGRVNLQRYEHIR